MILALALVGKGLLALAVRNLALTGEAVPAWVPAPAILAVSCGLLLVSGGIGLFFRRTRMACACGLALYEFFSVVARCPAVLRHPSRVGGWENLCEAVALFSGVLLLAARASPPGLAVAERMARGLFGGSCVVFGLSHFAFAELTAGMVPRWLPMRPALAYLTGIAHSVAGLAIVGRRLDHLAAALEAIMLGLFVALVHLPSLWTIPAPAWAPTAAEQWAELLIALSLAGAAGAVADSLRDDSLPGDPRAGAPSHLGATDERSSSPFEDTMPPRAPRHAGRLPV